MNPGTAGDFQANGVNFSLPDVVSGTKTKGYSRSQLEYPSRVFSISNFTIPAGYGSTPVYGTEGAQMFRNPGYFSVDANIMKAITLPWFFGEKCRMNFSVEGFNIFNRPNLGGIDGNLSDFGTTLGSVTSAYQPRTFELRARFEF
jgi:hypothetical protein